MRGDPGRRGGGLERSSGGGGPGLGLVDEPEPLTPGWPAWDLETALRGLRDVGGMKATKLIARKRPGSTRSGAPSSVRSWAPPAHI
nr:DUF6308 family protein [Rhodococcus sp. DK17]